MRNFSRAGTQVHMQNLSNMVELELCETSVPWRLKCYVFRCLYMVSLMYLKFECSVNSSGLNSSPKNVMVGCIKYDLILQ
jgi:hypothetical protein